MQPDLAGKPESAGQLQIRNSGVHQQTLSAPSAPYREIYQKGSRGYWEGLDAAIRQLAEKRGLPYLRNDDSMHRPFNEPPAIVNYFYHEQIKRSAMKRGASESAASRGGLQPLMSKTPDNPAWTPNSNAAGRHRMSNDTSRSNDAAFSYPHTWQ